MRITLFKRVNDKKPASQEFGKFADLWPLFQHRALQPGEAQSSRTPPTTGAFSPAEYDGIGTSNNNVTRVHFGAIDIDGVAETDLKRILDIVKDLEVIVYSTWSNHNPVSTKPGPLSFRVLFPFSRPIDVKEWKTYWTFAERWALGLADPQTKDPRRLYYLPTSPHNAPTNFAFYRPAPAGTGGALDVDEALEAGARIMRSVLKHSAAPAAEQVEGRALLRQLTALDLEDVAAHLKKRTSPSVKAVGTALQNVVAGKPYAEPGDRDKKLYQMTDAIAEFFPSCEPTSVAELFRASVVATCLAWNEGVPDDDLEKVVEKLARAQERRRKAHFESLAVEHERLKHRMKEAWRAAGLERDHAYTEEELQGYAREAGTDVGGFQERWIVQRDDVYYVFFDGTYLPPITMSSLGRSLLRDLSPAHEVVDLFAAGEDKNTMKPMDEILRDYSVPARQTIIDLTASRSRYDPTTQSIVEAPCPAGKNLEASFDPEVDTWLRALFGKRAEQGLDWISVVTLLHKPCVALYLAGPAGVGKTLLAEGLARIWTKNGVTALGKALNVWNEGLTQCPLTFADETLPQDLVGKSTTVLREFLQNSTRKLSRKYMPDATMIGHVRVILAANNDQLLQTNEHLSEADIQATAERFMYMPCQIEAREYLESLGDLHARSFVTTDKIAKHALWLRENRTIKDDAEQGRFFFKGGSEELATALTTSSGVRSLICQWLTSFLFNRAILKGRGLSTNHVFVVNGQLHVSPQAISDHWDVYLQHHRAPMISKIADALEGLGVGRTIQMRVGNAYVPVKVIKSQNIEVWAEHNSIATREEVIRQLALPCNVDVRALNGYEVPNTSETQQAAAAETLPLDLMLGVKK